LEISKLHGLRRERFVSELEALLEVVGALGEHQPRDVATAQEIGQRRRAFAQRADVFERRMLAVRAEVRVRAREELAAREMIRTLLGEGPRLVLRRHVAA
jgi:hypothetical protein